MESLTFTDNETKYYGDLFTHLDSEGSGVIPVNQVHEFLRASKLPPEVLAQIGQLCGGAGQGWYGRRELFVALKFVAAAQRGLPVRAESLFLGVDLPLPRLHTNNNTHYENNVAFSSSSSIANKENCTSSPDLIQLSDSDCNTSQMVDGGYRMMESEDGEAGDERMSDPSGRMVSHSTSVSSPASDSPTPTNSVHEKTWNQAHTHWHGLINDEHRQLLGTEEDSSEGRSSGGGGRSSGGGVGEEEEEEEEYNVWSITEEQRQYYTEQFRAMQPDLTSLLSGTAAKEFFEKSKLPVNELSKIWQLSDVTRDGALSLQEFFTAMHLVVLRRNNIELPETLPPSLYPMLLRKSSSSGVEGGGNSGASGNSSVVPGGGGVAAEGGEAGGAKATPDPLSPSRNKEWTKFVDSPTSTLSSPGLKPVNFDFQKSAVEQDPKILHPKAVRLTPESKRLEVSEVEGPASFSPEQALASDLTSNAPAPAPGDLATGPVAAPTGPTGSSQGSPKKGQEGQDIKPIQRPLPRKPTAGSATGGLPPPPQSSVTTPPDDAGMFGPISLPSLPSGPLPAGAKKEAPPPPPPRPARTHARSSSLDLNKFSRSSFLGAPPAVPPRASPGATSPKKLIYQKSDGDMAGVEAGGGGGSGGGSSGSGGGDALFPLDTRLPVERARTSAFEVYRKPHQEFASAFERVSGQRVGEEEERTRHLSTGARPKDKREIQASIRTTTEKNTILTRLNSELNQELAEVMEERIALEMQLEQMKPFSS